MIVVSRSAFLWTVLSPLLLFAGCGQSERHALQGSVTLDGQPLPEGSIRFIPLEGTNGPSAGGQIKEGRFAVESDKGVFPGSFRVEIISSRETGRKAQDRVTGEMTTIKAQFLPPRYNRNSELTADVKKSGPNEFEFALESR